MTKKLMNQDKEIMDVLFTYPQTLAFVFRVEGNPLTYMKLSDAVFTPNDPDYVSAVSVMVVNEQTNELKFSQLLIPRGKELVAIKNEYLLDMLVSTSRLIKDGKLEVDPETLNNYKALGLINE